MVGELEPFLARLVEHDRFSGCVLVARKGAALFDRAYGLACRAHSIAATVDTRFNLASMNKMFTGVAVVQLAQRGFLSFTDALGRHLPGYPNPVVARSVTIHQLLTHTSGLGNYFNPAFQAASRERFRRPADFLPLFAADPPAFQPGERFRYSNAGYLVLGLLIERITGQDYDAYVRDHVFGPAGMVDTDAFELDAVTPRLAVGHTRLPKDQAGQPGPWRNNLFLHVIRGTPAGGGFSTVLDLHRFAEALSAHRLLDEAHTDVMLRGKVVRPGTDMRYGYGFNERLTPHGRIVGHAGAFPGISTQLDINLDQGSTAVVLANCDPPVASQVADKIHDLLARA